MPVCTLTWWKTGVTEPEMGGTIHTQSAGQPPLLCTSDFMCVMKLSVVE